MQTVELNHRNCTRLPTPTFTRGYSWSRHQRNRHSGAYPDATAGTFNGTNNVATLNARDECLVVYFDSTGRER